MEAGSSDLQSHLTGIEIKLAVDAVHEARGPSIAPYWN